MKGGIRHVVDCCRLLIMMLTALLVRLQVTQEQHAQEPKAVHLEGRAAARDPAKQREAEEKVAALQDRLSKAEEDARGSAARASSAEAKAEETARRESAATSELSRKLEEERLNAEAMIGHLREELGNTKDKAVTLETSLEQLQEQAKQLKAKVLICVSPSLSLSLSPSPPLSQSICQLEPCWK